MRSNNIQPTTNTPILPNPASSHYNVANDNNNASITSSSNKSSKASKSSGVMRINEPSEKDYKLERILRKFRSGKKLTPGELSYVARKAPEMYTKIVSVMQRREQLERRLETATKEDAAQIMAEQMGSIENIVDDFEKEATANHLREVFNEFFSTKSPDSEEDEEESDESEITSNKKKKYSINIRV